MASMMAHSLKSSAGTIGAEVLSARAMALEHAINGGDKARYEELLQQFEEELRRVLQGDWKHISCNRHRNESKHMHTKNASTHSFDQYVVGDNAGLRADGLPLDYPGNLPLQCRCGGHAYRFD